jgi:hypothetical protein
MVISGWSKGQICMLYYLDLCNFIDSLFYELTEETKECSILIRCESNVREDLKRWGVNFSSPKSIYFEGH